MHIAGSRIEGIKREFAGFELDTTAIELHSTNKRKIRLPYLGKLPDTVRVNDGAYITVNITVHLTFGVCLVVMQGDKECRYPIEATTKEMNNLLFNLFYVEKGKNTYHSRWDAGLTHYWLGHYQSAYDTWSRFVHEGHGICDVIDQLSPDALNRAARYIDYKKTA